MLRKRLWLPILAALVMVLATACDEAPQQAGGGGGEGQQASGLKISVVTHGQASDPFWSVVKNGVDAAAKDIGANVDYQAPQTFDMVAMSRLIDAAVASKPDGLVVSVPDAQALSRSIKAAVDAKIPVISMNSGSDVYKELGILAHVGQTEYEAGLGGGERMAAAGVKNAICVNQEVGNAALDLRCKGFTDAMRKAGGQVKVVAVNLADPTDAQQRITSALGNADGVFTLGPTGAGPALNALKQGNKLQQVKLATFDLSPEVLTAIDAGEVLFAIDQQQYLQGYLPIVFMNQYKRYGVIPTGIIQTGPAFVDKANAAQVIDLSEQGIR